MHTRKNVYSLGGDWGATILWYARGVKAMKARPLADPTSWRFYGAIHGYNAQAWTTFGYLSAGDTQPGAGDKSRYWNQCQHGSWYFLPWHRGYLYAFEANVRAEIVALGGPKTWALPYWNYFKPGQASLPPAFGSPNWPDGTGDNPLYVQQRHGPNDDGNVFVPVSLVNLNALNDPDFTGVPSGGGPGFGGVDTGFAHGGATHGALEAQPHDMVHVFVGGQNPGGLMSFPVTAGLDPIFWLHHANIDRLWEVWLKNPPHAHVDPTDQDWIKGPANVGERKFSMPMPGGVGWDYTPGSVESAKKLGYKYDDLAGAAPKTLAPPARLKRLKVSAAVAKKAQRAKTAAPARNIELVGATTAALRLSGGETAVTVPLDPPTRRKMTMTLARAAETATPDRVFLNLENVRGRSGAPAFHVYVGLAANAKAAEHPERLAGTIGTFGVREASLPESEHAGRGITYVLEITHIVDALHLEDALSADSLGVRIVPVKAIPEDSMISIGRISVYRQGK